MKTFYRLSMDRVGLGKKIVAAVVAFLVAGSVSAALVVEESFDYAAGAMVDGTLNGGTGFDGAWAVTNAGDGLGTITSGLSLTGVASFGNSFVRSGVDGDTQITREISSASQAALTADGSMLWFSALVGIKGWSNTATRPAFLLSDQGFISSGTPEHLGSGMGFYIKGNTGLVAYGVDSGGSNQLGSGGYTPIIGVLGTYLVVGKIEWNAAGTADTVSVWGFAEGDAITVDRAADSTLSLDLDNNTLDTVAWTENQANGLDEIRLGTNFASVIPDSSGSSKIIAFDANTDLVETNGTLVTLSWEVANATGLWISPDIGNVLPATVDGVGQTQVVVYADTYTLTVSNAMSTVSSDVEFGLPPTTPNILFLFADDLGWVDVATPQTTMGHGSLYHETPNINRLADEGISFTQAYTQQNCQPTRAALISGQFPIHNDVYNVTSLYNKMPSDTVTLIEPPDQTDAVDPATTSIAEMLKAEGYTTAWFGKNHGTGASADLGVNHGFDTSWPVGRSYTAKETDGVWYFGNGTPYDIYAEPYDQNYIDTVMRPMANGNDVNLLLGEKKHLCDAMGDAVVDYIKTHANRAHPFFCYVPFNSVHTTITSRADLKAKYDAKTKNDPRHTYVKYAAMIEGLDMTIGRALKALEDPNGDGNTDDSIVDNTLVVFMSDNGGPSHTSNEPLRRDKGTLFEGGLRVPLICRMPGVIATNTISSESVHVVDFYPTFAEFAEGTLPDPSVQFLDGESLAPILRGEAAHLERDSLIWHFPGYLDDRGWPRTVLQKRFGNESYKLFYDYEDGLYELYNLTQDIGESTNLLSGTVSQAHQEIAFDMNRDIRNRLIQSDAMMGVWRSTGTPVAFPPADLVKTDAPVPESGTQTLQFYDFKPQFSNGRMEWLTWESSVTNRYDIEVTTDLTKPFAPLAGYTNLSGMAGRHTTVLDIDLEGNGLATNAFFQIRQK